jgi:hypothetical protein
MSQEPDTAIRYGTDNLFADLGYADSDTHLLKARSLITCSKSSETGTSPRPRRPISWA